MTTYIDAVEDLQKDIMSAYRKAGSLRDYGTVSEKQFYNMIRGLLETSMSYCDTLHSDICKHDRADMKL